MKEREIERALYKLRRKIIGNQCLSYSINTLLIVAILSIILALMSHLWAIPQLIKYIGKVLTLSIFLAIGGGVLKWPSRKQVARIGDSLGYEERLDTYISSKHKESIVWPYFIKEVQKKLEEAPVSKVYRYKWQPKKIILSLVAILLTLLISMFPSPKRIEASKQEQINKLIQKEVKQLQESIQEKLTSAGLKETEEEQERVIQLTKQLQKELKQTYSYEEAAEKIQKLKSDLISSLEEDKGDLAKVTVPSKQGANSNRSLMPKGAASKKTLEKIALEMTSMEERLRSKQTGGISTKRNKDKSESLAEGEPEALKKGELTKTLEERQQTISDTTSVLGEEVNQTGEGTGSETIKGNGLLTFKGEKAGAQKEGYEIPKIDTFVQVDLEGQLTKEGQMLQDAISEGIGEIDQETLTQVQEQMFLENPLAYIENDTIPKAKVPLVRRYLESLREER